MSAKDEILSFLTARGIAFERYVHPPVFHMSDCVELAASAGSVMCKNYFLTTKSRRVYCLCIARPDAHFRTSDISHQAGTPRLSFADEAAMDELLRTYPGAVSPLGLMFDGESRVRLLADCALRDADILAFHPCDNTETLALSACDFFEKFLPATQHDVTFVDFREEGELC